MGPGTLGPMNWTDGVDLADELMPRRWKRAVALVMLTLWLIFPNLGSRVLMLYAQARADALVQELRQVLPTGPATQPPNPSLGPAGR